MAVWNGSWQPYALATNNKTNYSANDFAPQFPNQTADNFAGQYPYRSANDFASQYPYRSANDYAGTYPANKRTSRSFWVKTNNKGKITDISWDPKGGGWNEKSLTTGSVDSQFGSDFINKLKNAGFLDNVKNQRDDLVNNNNANNADIQNRQNAANQWNNAQNNNRNNAVNQWNNAQNSNRQTAANQYNQTAQESRDSAANQYNTFNSQLNQKNTAINNWSQDAIKYFENSQTGTYTGTRDGVSTVALANAGLTQGEINSLKSQAQLNYKGYYLQTRIEPWDTKDAASPPAGAFDPNYYKKETEQGQNAVNAWNAAKTNDDLDVISRYTLDTYLLSDYTSQINGNNKNVRGNAPDPSENVAGYQEVLTDAERQLYRDKVLGISTGAGGDQILLSTPEYDEEGNLINQGEIDTALEAKFAEILTSTDAQKQNQFGTLAQDVLKTTINELYNAKQQESNLALIKGLPGYGEILNINTTLANSILGDTGLGGILSLTGQNKTFEEGLENSISQITGVSSNSSIYNWQKWFDDTLLQRYEDYEYTVDEYDVDELKQYQERAKEEIKDYNDRLAAGEAPEKPIYLQIAEEQGTEGKPLDINNIDDFKTIMFNAQLNAQKEFMTSFIDGYIKPRFDQSKSMDEFISYLDVTEDEQNIFQSQSTVNKLKQIADLRAKSFLDLVQLSEKASKNFDAEFYLDPLAKNTKPISQEKQEQYALQKDIVANAFKNAQEGTVGDDGINWDIEAYRYGYEGNYKTDPLAFAKLHYEVTRGTSGVDAEGKGFLLDPAEDILPYEELQQKINDFGTEMSLRKELYGDTSFMQFVTPEEYADAILASVNPETNQEEWQKILQQLGLDGVDAGVEEVKQYLIDSFRTEEAKRIRENIKYLNEAKEKLDQGTLGVSYIERPEDKKEIKGEQTALYSLFQNAGYGGTEDEFYNDFMPDVDRSEQQLISKATSEKGLLFEMGNMDDPFSAFTSVSSLFGDDEEDLYGDETADVQPKSTSYFSLFGDSEDEEEPLVKSKAGQSFLSDFTSMFQGFS